MEIRRIETDLIPPAVASDRGAQVEMDRRPQEQQAGQHKREHHAEETVAESAMADLDTTTYDPEGHLHEAGTAGHAAPSFDVRA